MALNKAEREQINKDIERVGDIAGAKMAIRMEEVLAPFKILVLNHEHDLNDTTNGIKKTVKSLSQWRWIATGVLIALSSAVFWQIVVIASSQAK